MRMVRNVLLVLAAFSILLIEGSLVYTGEGNQTEKQSRIKERRQSENVEDRGWTTYLDDTQIEDLSRKKMDLYRNRITRDEFDNYYENEILPAIKNVDPGEKPDIDSPAIDDDVVYLITNDGCWGFIQSTSYWSVVAIRPLAPSDWDMVLWDSGLPACADYIGGSDYSGQAIDFVVVDYNYRAPQTDYVEVYVYDTGENCYLEWENGSDILTEGINGPFTHLSTHIAHVWDIYLNQNDTASVGLDITSGNGDLGISLFSPLTTSPYTASRSQAFLEMDQLGGGGNEGQQFVATETGWWSVVVWLKDGIETTYNLNVCVGSLPPPTLLDPVNGDNCVTDNTPDFDWTEVPNASSYGILIDNNSDFSSPEINEIVWTGSSFTPSALLGEGLNYWKVITFDICGLGAEWSQAWSFTVDTQGPPAANLVNPPDGADCLADNTPEFDWNDVAESIDYWIQVDNNLDFSSPEIDTAGPNSNYTHPNPLADGTYYWHVNSIDNCENLGTWSATWDFTIDLEGPSLPTLVSPANGDTLADNLPTFDWSDAADATGYQIQIDDNPDFSSPLIDEQTTSSEYSLLSSLPDGTFFWRVMARDVCDNISDWTLEWSFTIDTEGPQPPVLESPADGEDCVTETTPSFEWSDVVGAAAYGIQVDNNPDFSSSEIDEEVTVSTYTPSASLPDDTYYWKVRSKDGLGNWGGWSSVWNFTIDTQSPTVDVTYPTADIALEIGETVSIQWNADDPSSANSSSGDRARSGSGRNLRMDRKGTPVRSSSGRDPGGSRLSEGGGEITEGFVESIDILLSRDDGSSWDTIFTGLEDDGNEDWEVTGPESDSCKIRVVATDSCGNEGENISGRFSIGAVGISDGEFSSGAIPKSFSLSQNYPNPFNPRTLIHYDVPNIEREIAVELMIFDARGRLVRSLVNEVKGPGRYEVYWDGYDDSGATMSSGVYFYMMKTDGFMNIKKMILLK